MPSAGHGSMLLYVLLHLTGCADMTLEELKRFRQLGSRMTEIVKRLLKGVRETALADKG